MRRGQTSGGRWGEEWGERCAVTGGEKDVVNNGVKNVVKNVTTCLSCRSEKRGEQIVICLSRDFGKEIVNIIRQISVQFFHRP